MPPFNPKRESRLPEMRSHSRAVDPATDPRLLELVDALPPLGIPTQYAPALAAGYLSRLCRVVWANIDDTVGTADDVDRVTGFTGPPRTLAPALARIGYLRDIGGVYICPEAMAMAPEFVRARWKRWLPSAYRAAMKRAAASVPRLRHLSPGDAARLRAVEPGNDVRPAEPAPASTGLFDLIAPATVAATARASLEESDVGHSKLVKRWCELWSHRYQRNYPFQARDAKHISDLLKLCGGYDSALKAINAYLAPGTGTRWKGHPLGRLVSSLPEFVGRPAGSGEGHRSSANLAALIGTARVRTQAGGGGGGEAVGGGAGDLGGGAGPGTAHSDQAPFG